MSHHFNCSASLLVIALLRTLLFVFQMRWSIQVHTCVALSIRTYRGRVMAWVCTMVLCSLHWFLNSYGAAYHTLLHGASTTTRRSPLPRQRRFKRLAQWIEFRRLNVNFADNEPGFCLATIIRQFLVFPASQTSFITVAFMYIVRPASESHKFSIQIFIVPGSLNCPSRSFAVPWLRWRLSRSSIVPWSQRSRICPCAPVTFEASIQLNRSCTLLDLYY